MRIRVLFSDVDRTLTDENLVVVPAVIEAIRELRLAGVEVIFVSGKGAYETIGLAKYLGASRLCVVENGGVICNGYSLTMLAEKDEPLKAFEALRAELGDVVREKETSPRFTEVVLERSFPLDVGERVIRSRGLKVKILDSLVAYHVVNEGVDKGSAVLKVLSLLGADPAEAAAVGDAPNDIEMLKAVGFPVAVGNACDEVKELARFVARKPGGWGFVEVAKHILGTS